jgi:hypothetical protein
MSARFPLSAPKWRRPRYRRFEAGAHDVRRATLEVIARAFKEAGVEFIDEDGEARGCGYGSGRRKVRISHQAARSHARLMGADLQTEMTKRTHF